MNSTISRCGMRTGRFSNLVSPNAKVDAAVWTLDELLDLIEVKGLEVAKMLMVLQGLTQIQSAGGAPTDNCHRLDPKKSVYTGGYVRHSTNLTSGIEPHLRVPD